VKTISLNGPGSVSVIDQEIDQTFTPMAVLRVISSGVCAADSYLWSGNHPWDISYPIVPGHEIFGEVIELDSSKAGKLEIGSKVAVQVNVPCYQCELCKKNKFNMCTVRKHFGSTFKGSFAEKIALPVGSRVHSYTSEIDDLIGGLSETMANAIYCSRKIQPQKSDSVLILGMGSIGACLAHYLKTSYPDLKITVLTSSNEKRYLLEKLGIGHVSLAQMTDINDSFDVIFETSGYAENFKAGLAGLKPTGTAVIYGVFQEQMLFDFNQVSEFKELTLIGGHLADDTAFDLSVEFLSKNQNELKYLISNVVGFDDFTSAFSDPSFSQFKTIFQPSHMIGA
jgi:2-desacetyl-2-hydroxyethyl bacteriochlorophyllide A dehydrogenase